MMNADTVGYRVVQNESTRIRQMFLFLKHQKSALSN